MPVSRTRLGRCGPAPSPAFAQLQLHHARISASGAGFPVQISNCRAPCCTNISRPVITGMPRALGQLEQRRLQRVIDHIEDQRRRSAHSPQSAAACLRTGHAAGRRVDQHIEFGLGEVLVLERLGLGLLGQSDGVLMGAIDDEDLRALRPPGRRPRPAPRRPRPARRCARPSVSGVFPTAAPRRPRRC